MEIFLVFRILVKVFITRIRVLVVTNPEKRPNAQISDSNALKCPAISLLIALCTWNWNWCDVAAKHEYFRNFVLHINK